MPGKLPSTVHMFVKNAQLARWESPPRSFCLVRHQWLTSIILAKWEAEIRRLTVQGQPRQIVW
jgi:hypothetical protein